MKKNETTTLDILRWAAVAFAIIVGAASAIFKK